MIRGIIVCAAVTLVAAVSFGATIHVPSQQPTIQAGINAASNGDTVLVAPGTYTERLVVDGKSVAIKSSGGYGVTFFQWNAVSPYAILITNSATTSFDGFTWKDQSNLQGIYIDLGSSARILNNSFRNLSLNTESLIRGESAGSCEITRNLFKQISVSYMIFFLEGSPDVPELTCHQDRYLLLSHESDYQKIRYQSCEVQLLYMHQD
jgi:hypothetical protein